MDKTIIEENRRLVKKYPFLKPYDCGEDYDYSYTILDDIPEGWKTAFGEQLCEEIMQVLVEENCVDDYQVLQAKEKFGSLRWYCNGPDKIRREILPKYEKLSSVTCVECGRPATKISAGWISPWCDECLEKHNIQDSYDIDEFYESQMEKDEIFE